MNKTYARTIRFDDKDFHKAQKILARQGLSMPEAVNYPRLKHLGFLAELFMRLFTRAVIAAGGMPFEYITTYNNTGRTDNCVVFK